MRPDPDSDFASDPPSRFADGGGTGSPQPSVPDEAAAAEPAPTEPLLGLYRDVLENIDVDIAVLDPELRFEYLNPASVPDPELRARLIGRTNRDYCDLRGQPLELAEGREQLVEAAVVKGGRTEQLERIEDAEGGVHYVLRCHLPLYDDQGRLRRVLGYGFDRTKEVAHAEALQRREEELQEGRRLDSVGRLAGGFAHEFNNLLTAIRGQAELLLEDVAAGDLGEVEAVLADILTASDRAAALVGSLLAFSRRDGSPPEDVDVGAAIEGAAERMREILGPKSVLELVAPPDPVRARVAPGPFRQALAALASNAAEAMPGGGALRVSWSAAFLPGQAVIRFQDEGTGMDAATRARALEPFFTTKGPTSAGLGLSAVHGTAVRAGGQVTLSSEPGKGTTVEVRLPLVSGRRELVPPPDDLSGRGPPPR